MESQDESQDGKSTAAASATDSLDQLGSLDRLENRIVEAAAQLRRERESRLRAEQEAERLRALLADKDSKLKQARQRVESLLESIEKRD